MTRASIYSIGYGNRKPEDFLALLDRYGISFLVDVRSRPYSKFNPQFSKGSIENLFAGRRLKYVFMGDTLGGQPSDPSCYTDGQVDYRKCRSRPVFVEGLARLKTAWEKNLSIALMCGESKPQECHRSKLIGQALSEMGIGICHIDERGELRTHADVIGLLTAGVPGQLGLFGEELFDFRSRKKYTSGEDGQA